jgi:hypothetical protein
MDVFESLNSRGVQFDVIGGINAIIHSVTCAMFDLDMLIDASFENARKLLTALEDASLACAM